MDMLDAGQAGRGSLQALHRYPSGRLERKGARPKHLELILSIALLLWAQSADAFRLCWTNPTSNVDGSPLEDLYRVVVYIGKTSRQYDYRTVPHETSVAGAQICTNIKVSPGVYFVAATAVDAEGNESAFSNEVQKTETRELDTPTGGRLDAPTGGRILQ